MTYKRLCLHGNVCVHLYVFPITSIGWLFTYGQQCQHIVSCGGDYEILQYTQYRIQYVIITFMLCVMLTK